jgi:hypothetical protein
MAKFDPRLELGFVPEGGSTKRCETCGRDVSVAWVICALSQMHPEEKWMIWMALRADESLQAFRAARKKMIT